MIVFVVEDGRTAAKVVAKILENEGHSFIRATSAMGARSCFRPGKYAMAIVDIGIPESEATSRGQNDLSLARWLREKEETLPIVIWTGQATPEIRTEAMALNCLVISKDEPHDKLTVAVRLACRRRF